MHNANQATQLREFAQLAKTFSILPVDMMDGQAAFRKDYGECQMVLLTNPDVGLPYGRLPRLIVAYLSAEAKRTGDRRIFVGNSLQEFATLVGVKTTDGDRGDLTRLCTQGHRLFAAQIRVTELETNRFKWQHINIADNGHVLWAQHDPIPIVRERAANTPWPSYIELSEPFARECINHAVPVDINTIRNLSGPMAIDVYMWLTYRYFLIGDEMTLNWPQLKWLFSDSFADSNRGLKTFKTKFREILTEVTNYYPEAKIVVDDIRGVTLLPSQPTV